MKFDEELLLLNLETIIKANLNTKIAALNTEKNDTISLATVNNSAYIMDVNDKEVNYNPYIIYMISEQTSEARGPVTIENIIINVALIHSDNGLDPYIVKRMLRYRRCLKEVIEENFRSISPCDSVTIESLPVLSFQKSNSSYSSKVVGINIITSIA